MKKIILGTALFLSSFSLAQVKFEKGYVIDKKDNKKEVYIKNMDWEITPSSFYYKLDNNSKEVVGSLSDTKEFGIYGKTKYVFYNGNIDISSTDLSNLSSQYEPEYKNSSVFLKELTSGNKRLYTFHGINNASKFFYSDEENPEIKPLIYKKYYLEGNESRIATNDTYIKQLEDIFKNDPKIKSLITKAKYNEKSLLQIFTYNSPQDIKNNLNKGEDKKINFGLNIRPGINFYSPIKTTNLISQGDNFPSTTNFRLGVEAVITLPFNRNKWAIIVEPTYSAHTFKEVTAVSYNSLYSMGMDSYSFINIPIGIRHSMFLNENSKFFVNASINSFRFNTGNAKNIDFYYNGTIFDKTPLSSNQIFKSMSFGGGYTYKNKYTVEVRYDTPNNIIDKKTLQTAKYSYTSIILGYNIF